MTKRELEILKYITKYNGKISYKLLSEFLYINERSIRYDIDKINEILKSNNYPQIEKIEKGQIKYIDLDILNKVIDKFVKCIDITEYKDEILLFKILFFERINLKSIEDEFGISRTSVKNILKVVKEKLKVNELKLEIEVHKGLVLVGDEENIRKAQLKFILTYSKDIYFSNIIEQYYAGVDKRKIENFLNLIIDNTKYIISDEPYTNLYHYILIMIDRLKKERFILEVENQVFFQGLKEYKVINRFLDILEKEFQLEISLNEKVQLTDYFLGSHCYSAENSSYKFWIEIDIIAKKIIKIFSENMGVNLSRDKALLKGIINHLKPTIHRLKNRQVLENSILKDFLKLYKPIFVGTKKSIKPLKNFINLEITEDEIAFLAIHFKAALDRANKLENRKNNILVVCSSGYGTSKLLSQQINENFSVNIVEVIPFYRLKDYDICNVDLVVGTINMDEVELQKPCITINTILSKEDIILLENIGLNKRKNRIFLSDLLETFKKNGTIKNENSLINDLSLLMNEILINDIHEDEPKLSEMLEEIILDVECQNWEEAIRMSGNIMVENEICDITYIENIVERVKEFGPYMIMNNKVALPHSKNIGNVFKNKMVLMSFRNDVLFPEETPVKTMLTFTSQDENSHLEALSNFLDLVNNYKFLEKLESNPSKKKVIDIIKKYEFLSNLGKAKDTN
ncbi:MAG: BglG family transcription antiterminator [Cetobacterium sp.]|uniref:BglG family transcription antiterminator n=1 Tax=Cetobacterium sp. TaxID=2071632 RepID=UPI003F3EFF80